MEHFLSEHGDALGEPRPGVSICFANPAQSASCAYVIWTPESYRRVILAQICNQLDDELHGAISLEKFHCRKTLLKTVDGVQHLLLADSKRVAQVRCVGDDIRVTPFAMQPVIEDFPNVERLQRLIQVLADLYRNRGFSSSNTGWTVEGLRHRDALAALDRRCLGCSYREIALFLYGQEMVGADWRNPSQTMKNRVIRSVKRGERMVNGGYKTLLK